MKYLEILNYAWKKHLAPRSQNAPTVISTFAGCGGSSLGYSIAGFKELLAVEWEENAAKTFKANFPHVDLYHGDIAALSVEEVLKRTGLIPGQLDIFDGSPPCQGFSTAGKRKLTDDRNQLFLEFVRLLNGLKPKAFVMENVSGMVKGKMKVIFVKILSELKNAGYNVSARILNAKYFEVPQSRERIIFIGVRNDLEINPSHPKAKIINPFTICDAISDLPKEQNSTIDHTWIDESPSGRNTKTWHIAVNAKQGQKYGQQQMRSYWNKPFATICKVQGYLKTYNGHPLYTRAFSCRELARGASFPDQFKFFDDKGSERIGNSVPPLLMRAIAEHIINNILAQIVSPS